MAIAAAVHDRFGLNLPAANRFDLVLQLVQSRFRHHPVPLPKTQHKLSHLQLLREARGVGTGHGYLNRSRGDRVSLTRSRSTVFPGNGSSVITASARSRVVQA